MTLLKTNPRREQDLKDDLIKANLRETDLRRKDNSKPNEPILVQVPQGTEPGHRPREISQIPNLSRPSSTQTTVGKIPGADAPGDPAEEEEGKATPPQTESPLDPEDLNRSNELLVCGCQGMHGWGSRVIEAQEERVM